jgi:hypothetical protein
MSKVLVVMIMISSLVYGFDAVVKKSDIVLSINEKVEYFKSGDKFTLNSGDNICFVSGEGRVVISGKNYKISLNKYVEICKILPKNDNSPIELSLNRIVKPFFSPTIEREIDGMSRKSTGVAKLEKTYLKNRQAKYVVYQSNRWLLPVSLKVYDSKHNIVIEDVNKANIYTSFVIPMSLLKSGYTIKIKNGFDETVVETLVDFKYNKIKQ